MSTAVRSRPRLGVSLAGLLADLVLPVLAYYALRAVGASVWAALVVPSVIVAALAVGRWVRHRRLDVLGLSVLVVLVASVAVAAISGSPRFLLAKGAVFTAAIGAVLLVSLFWRRPLGFSLARDLIERTTVPTADWDAVWDSDARFRRAWRVVTAAWGLAMLVDAVALIIMAYRLPVDAVPALASALRLVTFVVLQVVTNGYLMVAGVWRAIELDPRALFRRRSSAAVLP